ncbi:MAG: serine/threonine-protein kinase [Nanoarchaeota archaeon]|nr:serine/threonine-protein kinase [Nanoarchaeota archaeon]
MGLENYMDIVRVGKGGQGITYSAKDKANGKKVCLKKFRFGANIEDFENDEFKQEELFIREANILRNVNHPQIPKLRDYFDEQLESGEIVHYMAMDFVEGKTLNELVEDGNLFDEEKAINIADKILYGLEYLHDQFALPIIHRDIKPSNIKETPEGDIMLLDFGCVGYKLAETMGGSTVAGSWGYSAPELFRGKAIPASDLYSVGATLVYLLSQDEPERLMDADGKICLDKFNISEGFKDFLEGLIEPNYEKRIQSAKDARGRLFMLNQGIDTRLVPVKKSNGKKSEVKPKALAKHKTIDDLLPQKTSEIRTMRENFKAIRFYKEYFWQKKLRKIENIFLKKLNAIQAVVEEYNLGDLILDPGIRINAKDHRIGLETSFFSFEQAGKILKTSRQQKGAINSAMLGFHIRGSNNSYISGKFLYETKYSDNQLHISLKCENDYPINEDIYIALLEAVKA